MIELSLCQFHIQMQIYCLNLDYKFEDSLNEGNTTNKCGASWHKHW